MREGSMISRLTKLIFISVFLILLNSSFGYASRSPEYSHNLGGMPISCSIYSDQASIGNVKTGDSMQKVKSVLGIPKSTNNKSPITYYYQGLTIKFVDYGGTGSPIVFDIDLSMNGNASTMDGVKVGMPESVLSEVYGTADEVHIERTTAPKLSSEDNEKYRKRMDKTIYTYYANPCLTMSFIVKSGIINSIKIHLTD